MMQLTFYQTQILEKIAQEFTGCTIREIRWQLSRTGKTATPPDHAKRPLPAATMEEMAKAQAITAGIQDPELGTILRRLICKRLVLERMGEQTVMKSPPQDP
jgi:hypothetical protein